MNKKAVREKKFELCDHGLQWHLALKFNSAGRRLSKITNSAGRLVSKITNSAGRLSSKITNSAGKGVSVITNSADRGVDGTYHIFIVSF
jgi:hypothetical protein